jgi:hypothetical protein
VVLLMTRKVEKPTLIYPDNKGGETKAIATDNNDKQSRTDDDGENSSEHEDKANRGPDNFNLTEQSDYVRIISDSDPLYYATWNSNKHGNFTFMDQDAYDDLPTLVDDADVHEK